MIGGLLLLRTAAVLVVLELATIGAIIRSLTMRLLRHWISYERSGFGRRGINGKYCWEACFIAFGIRGPGVSGKTPGCLLALFAFVLSFMLCFFFLFSNGFSARCFFSSLF